jgi:hypothetical protein
MILEQVFRTEDVVPRSSPGSTMAQLSQALPEHVDVNRGACEESGSTGIESNALSFRWAIGGWVYTKTGDGYYYDLEGMRYRRSGDEGQYTYEQVALVFEANNNRVSSPAVDAMVSKAIDYVIADTPLRLPTPPEL